MQTGTVLAGQDGVSPAISQQTGKPVTIEDLLRQRGLMAAGGKMSIYPDVPNATSATPTAPTTPVEAATPANTTVTANPMDAVLAARMQTENNVLPPGADTSDIPTQVFDEKPVGMNMPSNPTDFMPWLIGGAAGGGGLAAIMALRNRRKRNSGVNDPNFGANTGPAPMPGEAANGSGNVSQPRLMQGSNSAVGRARRMQQGTVDGGTIQGRAAPSSATARALLERQKLLTGPNASTAPASQQVIEAEPRKLLENRSGVNETIAQGVPRQQKKPSVKSVLKKIRVK